MLSALLGAVLMTACTPTPAAAPPPAPALMTWADLAKLRQGKPDATVRYGDDPHQVVDVWRPAGAGPFPTILMVHGGCWTTSIADRTLMNPIAADLRQRGYAVWNIDYRGVDRPGGGYPGTFADVASAADQLAVDAARYGLDPRRVVAVGHSAGGHLALWLAARGRLPTRSPLRAQKPLPIAHVVSLGGLPDLQLALDETQGCGPEPVRALIGSGRADPFADISIPRLVPLGVPQTLVNGEEDRIIPVGFAGRYAELARTAGDTVDVEMVAATGHVELIAATSAAWARTVAAIDRAFKR